MGIPSRVIDRANALLQREDRQLDQMLSELAASRATLESETRQVAALRDESTAARDEYRARLERLQERREKLQDSMRAELDQAFRAAHDEIAGVIRDLQRGGGNSAGAQVSAQEAALAREKLESLEQRTDTNEATARRTIDEARAPLDWRHIKPGDLVVVPGGGQGVLESLPDRRGKVSVRAASVRLVLPAEKIRLPGEVRLAGSPPHSLDRGGSAEHVDSSHAGSRAARQVGAATRATRERPRVVVERAKPSEESGSEDARGGTLHCDLRGMRVSDALDRVTEVLDDATADGCDGVEFIHGFGTGALRKAVREYLASSAYVSSYQTGGTGDRAGGDGVTIAILRNPVG
jgi:DNA mismatch repair protein MutS2